MFGFFFTVKKKKKLNMFITDPVKKIGKRKFTIFVIKNNNYFWLLIKPLPKNALAESAQFLLVKRMNLEN